MWFREAVLPALIAAAVSLFIAWLTIHQQIEADTRTKRTDTYTSFINSFSDFNEISLRYESESKAKENLESKSYLLWSVVLVGPEPVSIKSKELYQLSELSVECEHSRRGEEDCISIKTTYMNKFNEVLNEMALAL